MKIDSPLKIGRLQVTMSLTILMMILIFADALPPQPYMAFEPADLLGLTFCLVNILAQWQMFLVVRHFQEATKSAADGGDDAPAG